MFQEALAPVFHLCIILAAWLNIYVGISRRNSSTFLKALQFIMSTTIGLIFGVLRTAGFPLASSVVQIPRDIRTVYQHDLEPEITRTACCPKCFKTYSLANLPLTCTWRRSRHAKPCGAELWKQRRTRTGVIKQVPQSRFSSQSFESWLGFFLGRSEIEEHLEQDFQKDLQRQNTVHNGPIRDVQDSPAWRTLGNFVLSRYHLVWAIYIDWFNPYTNKIAGKIVSCRAIVLYCLNLPIEVRFLLKNVFILGMIPAPHEPNPWTISHIMDSVIQTFITFAAGKLIATYRNPQGVLVSSRILALLADIGAIRKIAGYMAHNANYFCSFCLLHHRDIEELDYNALPLRDSATVSAQARAWKAATTITEQNRLSKESGVRWTPIHGSPGWDAVHNVMLGFMHNWLEGVLKHHRRVLWGIGRKKAAKDKDELFSDSDISESASDLDELQEEHQRATQQNVPMASNDDEMEVDDEQSAASTTPTPSTFLGLDVEGDDDDDADFIPDTVLDRFELSDTCLKAIRACIRDVDLPTWVVRPPNNLGEAIHGKLKAQEYLVLFTVILPLVLPELWWQGDESDKAQLQNFYHLAACTNILASFSASNAEADNYTTIYRLYRTDLPELFPGFHSMPNHHFAMHNGALLKFWGPLATLSEFPGERMNGTFGKQKHNRRVYDIPNTMLTKVSRRGRLEAFLSEDQFTEGPTQGLAQILDPHPGFFSKTPERLSSAEVANILAKGTELSPAYYHHILQYLRSTGQLWRDYEDLPHPAGSLILPPRAAQRFEFTLDSREYSCQSSHLGNSGVEFNRPTDLVVLTGFIEAIWQIPLEDHMRTFVAVEIHRQLPAEIISGTPFPSMPRLDTWLVDAQPSGRICIIEPRHILTHLTAYRRPKGTYGIEDHEVVAICQSLNRGRRT
ncbi:hypothetical protein DFH06DRAFT_1101506 [Mycena polygramma]|nr:hypothetical protein DFH06DRAFT_1101506 [Mycena polygramma]